MMSSTKIAQLNKMAIWAKIETTTPEILAQFIFTEMFLIMSSTKISEIPGIIPFSGHDLVSASLVSVVVCVGVELWFCN